MRQDLYLGPGKAGTTSKYRWGSRENLICVIELAFLSVCLGLLV